MQHITMQLKVRLWKKERKQQYTYTQKMRFGILELRNWVAEQSYVKNVILWVTNSKIFIEILLSSIFSFSSDEHEFDKWKKILKCLSLILYNDTAP